MEFSDHVGREKVYESPEYCIRVMGFFLQVTHNAIHIIIHNTCIMCRLQVLKTCLQRRLD